MFQYLIIFLISNFISLSVKAEGLVPCDDNCDLCYFIVLIQNVYNYLFSISIQVAGLFLTIGALIYGVSIGIGKVSTLGKDIMRKSVTGYFVFLASFLMVNTVLYLVGVNTKILGDGSNWNKFSCEFSPTTPPAPTPPAPTPPKPTPICGNGKCESGENYINCPSDCPYIIPGTTSCDKIVSSAQAMDAMGCGYSQAKRNSCAGNPPYTDCSNFVDTSYKKAGCSSPGNVSGVIGSKSEPIGNPASLAAGDVLWVPGHVVICQDSGCKTVIHASGTKDGIKVSNGSYYINKGATVVRAKNYCPNCGR